MKINHNQQNTIPSVFGLGVVFWLAGGCCGVALGGVGLGGGKETELTRDGGLNSLRAIEPVLGNSLPVLGNSGEAAGWEGLAAAGGGGLTPVAGFGLAGGPGGGAFALVGFMAAPGGVGLPPASFFSSSVICIEQKV